MVDDVKSLTKKCTDLEKRLKFAEAKIKVLADAMTSSKDMEKYADVLFANLGKGMDVSIRTSETAQMRAIEFSEKSMETYNKKREKEFDQESKKIKKELDRLGKESIRQTEFAIVQSRLVALEAIVAGLSRR